jgi:NADH-quinone oxidoreductase subunit N
MLLKLANYHNLLNWFGSLGIILVTIGMFFKIAAVPFHFGRLMFMNSYFDHCLNEHIGKSRSYCYFKLLTIMNADISPAFQLIIVIISMASMTVGIYGIATSKRKTY